MTNKDGSMSLRLTITLIASGAVLLVAILGFQITTIWKISELSERVAKVEVQVTLLDQRFDRQEQRFYNYRGEHLKRYKEEQQCPSSANDPTTTFIHAIKD